MIELDIATCYIERGHHRSGLSHRTRGVTIIVASCDTPSLVLIRSGAPAQLHLSRCHSAIVPSRIDIHKAFTHEARERLSNAPAICETADAPQRWKTGGRLNPAQPRSCGDDGEGTDCRIG